MSRSPLVEGLSGKHWLRSEARVRASAPYADQTCHLESCVLWISALYLTQTSCIGVLVGVVKMCVLSPDNRTPRPLVSKSGYDGMEPRIRLTPP